MEWENQVLVTKEAILEHMKIVLKANQRAVRMRIAAVFSFSFMIFILCHIVKNYVHNFHKIYWVDIVLLPLYIFLCWYCTWGYSFIKFQFMKKEIEKQKIQPSTVILTFSEKELMVVAPKATLYLPWNEIKAFLISDKYYFIDPQIIVIDRMLLTSEQEEFIKNKIGSDTKIYQ